MIEIRRLHAADSQQYLSALADVLVDCVEGGASVSFMAPFTKAEAEAFFADCLKQEDRIVLAAFDGTKLVGTVQMVPAWPPNQPHRADIAKLLVHRSARNQGVAALLMQQVEEASRQASKTLLVLDTVTGDAAERLYTRLGWTRVGVIPDYALYPDGRLCATTVFYKQL